MVAIVHNSSSLSIAYTGMHVVFGKVVEGQNVIQTVERTPGTLSKCLSPSLSLSLSLSFSLSLSLFLSFTVFLLVLHFV